MAAEQTYQYFEGDSFFDVYGQDIGKEKYAFLLPYPTTAGWASFPNTKRFFIQDGAFGTRRVGDDKVCRTEPWRIMAVLGDQLRGVLTLAPPETLVSYWRDAFKFHYHYENMVVLDRTKYCNILNESPEYEKVITLFPYDHLLPEKHAVDPEKHYYLLSKCALNEVAPNVPKYETYDLLEISPENITFPKEFPFIVKVSHGLSGEGTYIIKRASDLSFCLAQLRRYVEVKLIDFIIVMDFVKNAVDNYCVQFYINKAGEVQLIGATNQLVSEAGVFLGGLIHFRETDMAQFFPIITHVSQFAHQHGYFGVIGVDVLKDRDGQLHVIDANIRVNGSTPLCLQRHSLLKLGKEVAKFSTDYYMEGSLEYVLATLKEELKREDFLILSALEILKNHRIETIIYGIVTGETVEEMLKIEEALKKKGLQLVV